VKDQNSNSRSADESRDTLLRRRWAATLANHGINSKRLLAGRIRDDKLAMAATRAGFSERAIIEMLRLFSADPEKLPAPAIASTRAERTEVIRQRVEKSQATSHPLDKPLSELDDHHTDAPEGKPHAHAWENEMQALAELEAEAARPVDELDYLDELPREIARRLKKKIKEKGGDGGNEGENNTGPRAILALAIA
jgi:hypothetical protein